jgi:hypothetical protein
MNTGLAQAQPLPPEPLDRVGKFLLIVALALLVPTMARALPWLYEQGKLPIKPRDYTLVLLVAMFGLLLLNRPKLCLPSFIILTPPLLRVLDAAFLRRFDVNLLGEHSVFVMNLLSAWLVSFASVALLSSSFRSGCRSARTSANLIQAQRDYFGAHTYERVDKPRHQMSHTNWTGRGGTTASSSYNA